MVTELRNGWSAAGCGGREGRRGGRDEALWAGKVDGCEGVCWRETGIEREKCRLRYGWGIGREGVAYIMVKGREQTPGGETGREGGGVR